MGSVKTLLIVHRERLVDGGDLRANGSGELETKQQHRAIKDGAGAVRLHALLEDWKKNHPPSTDRRRMARRSLGAARCCAKVCAAGGSLLNGWHGTRIAGRNACAEVSRRRSKHLYLSTLKRTHDDLRCLGAR